MTLRYLLKSTLKRWIERFQWIGYSVWKQMGESFLALVKRRWLLSQGNTRQEASFQEVVQQLKLSEVDLFERQKRFRMLVKFWLSLFVLAFFYGIYLAILRAWFSVISMFVLEIMILFQAFQYHFWCFQMMQRRLNCTFQEWWHLTFRRGWPW